MNNETAYLDLLEDVLLRGKPTPSRAGETLSTFGNMLTLDMLDRKFPLVLTRRVYPMQVLAELECFIKGTSRLSDFVDAGCNYWTLNAQAWRPGENMVGRIYGVQWRHWRRQDGEEIDQLVNLVEGLRDDPYGRRHILTAWNPGELAEMCLPPCHVMAQFNLSGAELDCLVTMRSVDLCLGLPSDMILYGMLLYLVGKSVV